jgi:hypothetical protein
MKTLYTYYLPLISRATGWRFVLQGHYTELPDGTIILASGEECDRNLAFPNARPTLKKLQ